MRWFSFWICLYIFNSDTNGFIVPDEIPTALSVIYSNIPKVKFGTDSRIGWGFRFGDRADAQILVELGPQHYTQPLANQQPSDNPNYPELSSSLDTEDYEDIQDTPTDDTTTKKENNEEDNITAENAIKDDTVEAIVKIEIEEMENMLTKLSEKVHTIISTDHSETGVEEIKVMTNLMHMLEERINEERVELKKRKRSTENIQNSNFGDNSTEGYMSEGPYKGINPKIVRVLSSLWRNKGTGIKTMKTVTDLNNITEEENKIKESNKQNEKREEMTNPTTIANHMKEEYAIPNEENTIRRDRAKADNEMRKPDVDSEVSTRRIEGKHKTIMPIYKEKGSIKKENIPRGFIQEIMKKKEATNGSNILILKSEKYDIPNEKSIRSDRAKSGNKIEKSDYNNEVVDEEYKMTMAAMLKAQRNNYSMGHDNHTEGSKSQRMVGGGHEPMMPITNVKELAKKENTLSKIINKIMLRMSGTNVSKILIPQRENHNKTNGKNIKRDLTKGGSKIVKFYSDNKVVDEEYKMTMQAMNKAQGQKYSTYPHNDSLGNSRQEPKGNMSLQAKQAPHNDTLGNSRQEKHKLAEEKPKGNTNLQGKQAPPNDTLGNSRQEQHKLAENKPKGNTNLLGKQAPPNDTLGNSRQEQHKLAEDKPKGNTNLLGKQESAPHNDTLGNSRQELHKLAEEKPKGNMNLQGKQAPHNDTLGNSRQEQHKLAEEKPKGNMNLQRKQESAPHNDTFGNSRQDVHKLAEEKPKGNMNLQGKQESAPNNDSLGNSRQKLHKLAEEKPKRNMNLQTIQGQRNARKEYRPISWNRPLVMTNLARNNPQQSLWSRMTTYISKTIKGVKEKLNLK